MGNARSCQSDNLLLITHLSGQRSFVGMSNWPDDVGSIAPADLIGKAFYSSSPLIGQSAEESEGEFHPDLEFPVITT